MFLTSLFRFDALLPSRNIPGVRDDLVRHCLRCYTPSSVRRPSSDRGLAAAVGVGAGGAFTQTSRTKTLVRWLSHSSEPSLPPTSEALKNRIALRPPRTVKSVLTTLLDQLTVSQRMIMKTASVIGAPFDEDLLRGSCPIMAHLSRFSYDIDELERLSMIRRIDNFVGRVPTNTTALTSLKSPVAHQNGGGDTGSSSKPKLKVKFEFGHGFMQDVIQSQMLCNQLNKLKARIQEFTDQHDKELRLKYLVKVNETRSQRPQPTLDGSSFIERRRGSTPINGAINLLPFRVGSRRALTPTDGRHFPPDGSRFCSRTPSSSATSSSAAESSSQLVQEDAYIGDYDPSSSRRASPSPSPSSSLRSLQSSFVQLKSGHLYVKKTTSVFSHFKQLRTLTNARMWKKRFAVLQNARLLLQYDEQSGSQPRQGTSLFLKGAKVSACDPEVAAKVNCFQVEVNEWTKGKYLISERRAFVLDAQSEREVGDWVFMIRYAIESLENQ